MSWSVPRFDHLVDFAAASHTGKVRKANEDVLRADPGLGLFAVADGMGGHAAGEVAARIAVDELGRTLRTETSLRIMDAFVREPTVEARRAVFEALGAGARAAHEAVLDSATRDVKRRGMGCTLDAVLLLGTKALLVHAGDGRSYLSRPTTTIQLTHDHTLHGTLVARGLVTPSERPGGSKALTNAVGRKGGIHVDEIFCDLHEGDRLILCTDGIHGEIDDESVLTEIGGKGTVTDAAFALVKAALDCGGSDNATAIVVHVGSRRPDRVARDVGLASRDAAFAAHSPLLIGLPDALVKRALGAAVEVEFDPGKTLPRFFASDRVGYIVLEGCLASPNGWTLGPSSLVYPESLGGGGQGTDLTTAVERTRALRIRADDFREVCQSDQALAARLYERLTEILARTGAT